MDKPQPLQPEELKALSEWLALGPNFTLSAHEQRRLIATIEEARREQPVRVTDEMVRRLVVRQGKSPENAYAMALSRADLAFALAAAPKEGGE